jgi:transcriptional regulator with XRE-family HTH domain
MKTLSQYLTDRGITQKEFADRVGLDQATISRICRGSSPSLHAALKIETETGGAVPIRSFGQAAGDAA